MADKKQKANKPEIKVTAKNRPSKEDARIQLKQLGEFLSSGERRVAADNSFDALSGK